MPTALIIVDVQKAMGRNEFEPTRA